MNDYIEFQTDGGGNGTTTTRILQGKRQDKTDRPIVEGLKITPPQNPGHRHLFGQ